MSITIRQEKDADYPAVEQVIVSAFEEEEFSDQTEHLLVSRLRKSNAFIPELSLVAENGKEIVGHILLTRIKIKGKQNEFDSLALAPVSVAPNFQKMGIGGNLITRAHEIARKLGHKSIILLGHQSYYPRFGYKKAHNFGIELPFEAPKENCMALELVEQSLDGVSGKVEYPTEFYE